MSGWRDRRTGWGPARALRAEFGERRLNRAVASLVLRAAVLAGLFLLGAGFLIP